MISWILQSLWRRRSLSSSTSDFEMLDPGSPCQLSTYGLLLEITGRSDGTYWRVGLVHFPSGNQTASIQGFDLRIVSIT